MRWHGKIGFLLAVLTSLVALTAGGCKKEEVFVGGKAFRPKMSVISLSPSTTEVFATFGDSRTLRGKTAACDYPGGIELAEVVVETKPDYEKIVSLKPDLVLYDRTLYSDAEIEKIKAMGVETLELDPSSIEKHIDFSYRVGKTQQDPMRMNDYVQKIRAAVSLASGNPPQQGTSAAVLIGNPREGEYFIAGDETFQADLVRVSGGEFVGPKAKNFVPLSVESLLQWNPTIIITTKDNALNIAKDPRLRSLSAVKNNRVAELNPDILLRAGARVDTAINIINGLLDSLTRPAAP